MGILSDDDFLKVDRDAFMEKVDNYDYEGALQSYQNEPVEPQQPVGDTNTPGYTQEANTGYPEPSIEEQTNYGVDGTENTTSTTPETTEIDYKGAYDKITAPFKAVGKEFQVRNIDEAISLMQKGVDYTRKQQALKPRLMELRTLENQGMLGDNLNYAIDLYNGKPEAIAKLIQDKGIDLNSLGNTSETDIYGNTVSKSPKYTPTNYSISPEKYELSEVVDELKSNNLYDKVANAYEGFDSESRSIFLKKPSLMLELGGHISSGLYDKIQSELERARIVNSPLIQNLSDFDAYTKIGMMLTEQQRGQQVQQQQNNSSQQQQQQQQRQVIQQRKQSVSSPRNRGGFGLAFDPLSCSDDEFAKIDIKQLLRG